MKIFLIYIQKHPIILSKNREYLNHLSTQLSGFVKNSNLGFLYSV
ncbi:hypothetical protein Aconfl_37030 [Algoriphagus confluentis]|uniref:Uncharacterized protein n=1 Tax=Algoriphagus confluentis TaxID=1697556 RepID=A0ABQ6PUX5_9BACT|nr:hypothetical protein Aconfl_37030 [Algoriphagus confluentis]